MATASPAASGNTPTHSAGRTPNAAMSASTRWPAWASPEYYATSEGMKPKRRRRAGATETVGVSLDPETKRKLKALADERHRGNVSALIGEMTDAAVRQAAFERAWRWYGGSEPSPATRAKIDNDLEKGWAHARKHAGKKSRRRTAA